MGSTSALLSQHFCAIVTSVLWCFLP